MRYQPRGGGQTQRKYYRPRGGPGQAWPTEAHIRDALEQQHYVLEELPPVAEVIASLEPQFVAVGAWPLEGGRKAQVFSRLTPRVGEPESGWPTQEAPPVP